MSHVRIAERLGVARCLVNHSWGVRRGYIWVDRGCRARFVVIVRIGRGGNIGRGYPGHGGRYEDRHDGDRHRAGPWGDDGRWRGNEQGLHVALRRARAACLRQLGHARVRVSRFGTWRRERGNVWRADVQVRGGMGRRVRCVYDPHRGTGLSWLH